MWRELRPLLQGLHPVRIESPITAGVPDVNFTQGWIELKHVEKAPKRPWTPLRVPHFTAEQRAWHVERYFAGGRSFVLLRVGREWLLFLGVVAAAHVGKLPLTELRAKTVLHTVGTPDRNALRVHLISGLATPAPTQVGGRRWVLRCRDV